MSETATGGQSGASEGTEARQSMATGTESRKSKRLLIFGGLAALLLIGGGTTVFVEKGKRFQNMKENVFNGADHALHPPIVLAIPPIISNLDSGDGRPVYVKLTAKVEISGARDEASLITLIPRVQDIFQTYLHETRPQDIRGDGIYRLREAIMRRLRAELTPLQVTNLYLVEFLIQ